jgi:two-component system alkaline phosphatase synthesis response regulator PhoP
MSRIFIIAQEIETGKKLQSELTESGFSVRLASNEEKGIEHIARESPELILVEMNGHSGQSVLHDLTHSGKIKSKVPILALVEAETLRQPSDYLGVDDFIVRPYDSREIVFRVKRLLQKNVKQDEILNCGDLVIDLANCEVRVEGKVVELTFKEYELLKFLANDRGRVYTREALLNKVWGYDYFGGDRTVDVHIRRLRSKIELSGQTFIETVRNIGYRFTKSC